MVPTIFKILIAYEDFEAGIQARRLADSLANRLGCDYRIQTDTWKFELLGHPRLRELIARATGEADMLIIAARGGELPAYVKGWLEAWASSHTSDPVVLVALHNLQPDSEPMPEVSAPSLDEPPPLLAYLRAVAAQNRVDFFWCGKDSETEPLCCLESGFHHRYEALRQRPDRAATIADLR